MARSIVHVDAFTSEPFAGNPAAVCVLSEAADTAWMQNVAREMNLSETAFLSPHQGDFGLRWFTPAIEVDLCGHATLASAHVLWEGGHLPPERPARFHTRSGLLTATRQGEWIELDFPLTPEEPATPPAGLVASLGVTPRYVGRSKFDYIVELDSEDTVRRLEPDFARLGVISTRGVICTSRASTSGYDFVSRFFAPAAGINEDPVTGSAHCCLAPFWRQRLGKDSFMARQISPRGGVLKIRINDDRVLLGGQAVTVLRAELFA